jgi:putative ABC transport system substrate-binding protein
VNPEPLQTTARSLERELHPFGREDPDELDRAFLEMAKRRVSAVVIPDDTLFTANTRAILDLAARNRVPSAGRLAFAEAGGLMTYEQSIREVHRRATIFVDKILKGAKPGDLPIEQPTKFGLRIPPAVLARADEAIQ